MKEIMKEKSMLNDELANLDKAVNDALRFVQDCMAGTRGVQSAFEAAQVYMTLSNQRMAVMRELAPNPACMSSAAALSG